MIGLVCLLVREYDEAIAFYVDRRILAAGVRFLEEPRREAYGRVAVFEDLYGNRWDLIQQSS